jgi:hypothetical protein
MAAGAATAARLQEPTPPGRPHTMRIASLAAAWALLATSPFGVHAQQQDSSVRADEQIILKQVMTDKRAVYTQALKLSDDESRKFWPIYDEYEAKVKQLDDRFLNLVNDFAAKYSTMTDADAKQMLETKMKIERERMDLKQSYTRKVAKALPPIKALRYAQVETRIDNELRRNVYNMIPLVQ